MPPWSSPISTKACNWRPPQSTAKIHQPLAPVAQKGRKRGNAIEQQAKRYRHGFQRQFQPALRLVGVERNLRLPATGQAATGVEPEDFDMECHLRGVHAALLRQSQRSVDWKVGAGSMAALWFAKW